MKKSSLRVVKAHLIVGSLAMVFAGWAFAAPSPASSPDPLASNNALYPDSAQWAAGYRTSNFDYPTGPVQPDFAPGFGRGALNLTNAGQYMSDIKALLAPTIGPMINAPLTWSPSDHGWYDMPWSGFGESLPDGRIDPTSGRDAILGSYTGQVLPPTTFSNPVPAKQFQNHAVIYYNPVAATMLGKLWADLYKPDLEHTQFPQGSITVKVEAVTLTPEQWPVVRNSAVSYVFRPTVETLMSSAPYKTPTVVPLLFTQLVVAVKDTVASPETGWVYMAFAYDADAPGSAVFDRAVPVGAMWGNDPAFTTDSLGTNPIGQLAETWISPAAPAYTLQTLGWGGRLSGPMDVATRHNVITVSGERHNGPKPLASSSCLSCHGAAQFPFTENLYPSPNQVFPQDGLPFLMYDPGSPEWARWFQNRDGKTALSSNGGRTGTVALDYDMLVMFSLGAYNAAMGNDVFAQSKFRVH